MSRVSQSELLCTLGPAVALVPLARPAGKLEPPNLACAWGEDLARSLRCPFHRILSWAGAQIIYAQVSQSELVDTLGPACALVQLARPTGMLEPPSSYTTVQDVTSSYTTLQGVTSSYTTLQDVTSSYTTVQGVTSSYTTLQEVTSSYTRLYILVYPLGTYNYASFQLNEESHMVYIDHSLLSTLLLGSVNTVY